MTPEDWIAAAVVLALAIRQRGALGFGCAALTAVVCAGKLL